MTIGALASHALDLHERAHSLEEVENIVRTLEDATRQGRKLIGLMGGAETVSVETLEPGAELATMLRVAMSIGLRGRVFDGFDGADLATVEDERLIEVVNEDREEALETLATHSRARLVEATNRIARVMAEDIEILLAHTTPPADRLGLITDYVRTKLPAVTEELVRKIDEAHTPKG